MNCQTLQNRLLALPDPRQLPEAARTHLGTCPGRAAWWKHAVRLENLLSQLPAPPAPANKKASFIHDLTAGGPLSTTVPAVRSPNRKSRFAEFFAGANAKFIAGVAAAVIFAVGGWLMMRPGDKTVQAQPGPRHPLLEKVVQRDVALARAGTPADRLEILGGLAEDLASETRGLARIASPEDLDELARWFDKVVKDGIGPQAERLPIGMNRAEKKALFDRLTAKLAETGQEADRAIRTAPPQSQPALKKIVDTARDGQLKLREISSREGA